MNVRYFQAMLTTCKYDYQEELLVDYRAYKPYTLVGHLALRLVLDPLAVIFLDNRLYTSVKIAPILQRLIVFETNQFLPFSHPLATFACRFFSLFLPLPPFPSCGGCHVFASSRLRFRFVFDSYLVISVSSVRASYEKRGRTGMRTFDPSERIRLMVVKFCHTAKILQV